MADERIESILVENRSFEPASDFAGAANVTPADLERFYQEADEDYLGYWDARGREFIHWHTPYTVILDDSEAPNFRWFTDGRLNVSYNCLDLNLNDRAEKTAIIFEGEGGDRRRLSYAELTAQVCRFANGLKTLGVESGDRVVIYMPMVPEAVIAMQACARIGAIHSVVIWGLLGQCTARPYSGCGR